MKKSAKWGGGMLLLCGVTVAAGAWAQDPAPPIHPLCLWEHPADEKAVEACQKRHARDRVDYRESEFVTSLRDDFFPLLPDEIREQSIGKLANGDEVFLVSSLRYGDRIDGTQVLVWRRAGAGPGGIQTIVSSGFRSQGGISDVAVLADNSIQVGINFDTAWSGIDTGWEGLPKDWNHLPAMGVGCGTCGMGIAHVIFPEGGKGHPVLGSVEIDALPEGADCKSGKVAAMANYLPHAFSPEQFGDLVRSLGECPE